MWIKCQDGSLVNLDNIVHVEKQYRYGQEEGKAYRVVAVGGRTEDDFYPLASKLTESEANSLLVSVYELQTGERIVADVEYVVRTIRRLNEGKSPADAR